jgi:hypothetical protein
MNKALRDFLEASSATSTTDRSDENAKPKRKQTKQGKNAVEGLWLGGRNLVKPFPEDMASMADTALEGDELDELIWWSWEGKIVGFSGW